MTMDGGEKRILSDRQRLNDAVISRVIGTKELDSVEELVRESRIISTRSLCLFRGQAVDKPLLPKVARESPRINTTAAEKALLTGLRYKGGRLFPKEISDWELLCIAQHYGATTRLLDWSSNPLVALWMAMCDVPWNAITEESAFMKGDLSGHVFIYRFDVDPSWIVHAELEPGPFDIQRTRVIKPPINNDRVAAQSGWFTAHRFQLENAEKNTGQFVPLERQRYYSKKIRRYAFKKAKKMELLRQLDQLGVNAHTLYTGIEGLCKNMAFDFEDKMESDWFLSPF